LISTPSIRTLIRHPLAISPPSVAINNVLSLVNPLFIVAIASWRAAGSVALTLPSDLTEPVFAFPSDVLGEFDE
jgi:hypothetical protein